MKCSFQIANCELHCFSFDPIDSRMYVLMTNNQTLIIDPCVDEDALQLLEAKNTTDVVILPTHEHYDHISGINWLRKHFKCKVIASEHCAKNMLDPRRNASAHFEVLFMFAAEEAKTKMSEQKIKPYICEVDELFSKHKCFIWQNHSVEIQETPGHSKGSVCIIIDDTYVFTGDSMIKGIKTITRLPGGSKIEFAENTLPFLKGLQQASIIFPGHGEAGYLHEFSL